MVSIKPSGAVIPAAVTPATGSPIAGVGFSGYSASGELALLDASLAKIAEMGADVAEMGVFGFEVISGGRITTSNCNNR